MSASLNTKSPRNGFPNLHAEMIRNNIDYLDIAELFQKSLSWVQNRMQGKTHIKPTFSLL